MRYNRLVGTSTVTLDDCYNDNAAGPVHCACLVVGNAGLLQHEFLAANASHAPPSSAPTDRLATCCGQWVVECDCRGDTSNIVSKLTHPAEDL
ncbi:hypothetical protein V6N13_122373 [Hibiscus sabdariffa]|uniref:Uncharacterized protein n=1 Tax=Hibiscus sabdariffa TaxID=183260 RepID=A0ABR2Q7H9_9ROSI